MAAKPEISFGDKFSRTTTRYKEALYVLDVLGFPFSISGCVYIFLIGECFGRLILKLPIVVCIKLCREIVLNFLRSIHIFLTICNWEEDKYTKVRPFFDLLNNWYRNLIKEHIPESVHWWIYGSILRQTQWKAVISFRTNQWSMDISFGVYVYLF